MLFAIYFTCEQTYKYVLNSTIRCLSIYVKLFILKDFIKGIHLNVESSKKSVTKFYRKSKCLNCVLQNPMELKYITLKDFTDFTEIERKRKISECKQ